MIFIVYIYIYIFIFFVYLPTYPIFCLVRPRNNKLNRYGFNGLIMLNKISYQGKSKIDILIVNDRSCTCIE